MIRKIKRIILSKPILNRFVTYIYYWIKLYAKTMIRLLLGRYLVTSNKKFIYPTILQLPITYKCNCDCIMCGMHEKQSLTNFSVKELNSILENDLYKCVKSVGVNGGEPFLVLNLDEYIEVLLTRLPKLENIYIITNGSLTNRTLELLEKIKGICGINNVSLSVSVSIDGVAQTHDLVRGLKGVFEKAFETCINIRDNQSKYCDNFKIICTITSVNIYNINEVDVWAKKNNFEIAYNIATVHERLFNNLRLERFSVFSDNYTRLLAAEFFHALFYETKSPIYFQLFYYCLNKERLSYCSFSRDGVTITPEGNLSYCATHSKLIGNALISNSLGLYKNNLDYRDEMCKKHCDSCSHYAGVLTFKGQLIYNRAFLERNGGFF